MARIACSVMLKNERTMVPRFLRYHAALFGAENIHVFDNGSTDPEVKAELERFEACGGRVDRCHATGADFINRHAIFESVARQLAETDDCDAFIPLDCDEFVALRVRSGYSADPDAIHACLDQLRGADRPFHVAHALVNRLGDPGMFQVGQCSKMVWPRGGLPREDGGRGTSATTLDDPSLAPACDLVFAHFKHRPFEEAVWFARQKLEIGLSSEEVADHARLRAYRGPGERMVPHIIAGADTYYRQFRNASEAVGFPELDERFAALGIKAPFNAFRLPSPLPSPSTQSPPRQPVQQTPSETAQQRAKPPLLVVDHASTRRVRGWASDQTAPDRPVFLHFLIDDAPVWQGVCDLLRPDVMRSGHPGARVGFDFAVDPATRAGGQHVLTITDRYGTPLQASVGGHGRSAITLTFDDEQTEPGASIFSHIDSFRSGRVQGWVLRTVNTPEGPRLLGCCTVALVHGGNTVCQAVADVVRADVAEAMQCEERCGFVIELPHSLLSAPCNPVLRLFVMPEKRELVGSPCIIAPSFSLAHART